MVAMKSCLALLLVVLVCCICSVLSHPTHEDKSTHEYHFGHGIKGKGEYAGHYEWKDPHGYGYGSGKGKGYGEASGYASHKGEVHSVIKHGK